MLRRLSADLPGNFRTATQSLSRHVSHDVGLILLILALLAIRLLLYALVAGAFTQLPDDLCLFDCGWLLGTAQQGYDLAPRLVADTTFGQANWVNFPFFPGLIFTVMKLSGLRPVLAGFIVANLSLVVFAYLAVKYLELSFRGIRIPLVLFLFAFPYGFYFSLTYTESTYAAVSMAAFYLLARRDIPASAIAACVLSATRVTGVLFTPIIVVHYLRSALLAWRGSGRGAAIAAIIAGILPIAIAPLGLFAFMAYLYIHTGDAFGFLHIQRAWDRHEQDPFAVLLRGVFANDLGSKMLHGKQSSTFATMCAFAGVAVCGRLLFLRRFAECWFLLASILISLSAGLLSFPRYCLASPIFVVWLFEIFWLPPLRRIFIPFLLFCLALQLLLVHLWLQNYGFFI